MENVKRIANYKLMIRHLEYSFDHKEYNHFQGSVY